MPAVSRRSKRTEPKKKTDQNAEEVSELTNEQLRERLSSYGIAIGPVVETTRKFYEKKLAKIMTESTQQYSTDEEGGAPVGAVAEPLPQKEAKSVKKSRTRAKREPEPVQDKFSDDEEEDIPVVKNTSSARRRSARIQVKKSTEKVVVEEPIVEEKEEQVVEAEVAVVENGTEEAAPVAEEEAAPEVSTEVVEEDSVETEQESHESVDEAPTAKRPIPYHTIVVVLLVAMALGLLWKEREQHVAICGSVLTWIQTEYSKLYDSLMPDVEQLPPQSEQ